MQQLLQRKLFVVCSNAAAMRFYNLQTFYFFGGDAGNRELLLSKKKFGRVAAFPMRLYLHEAVHRSRAGAGIESSE